MDLHRSTLSRSQWMVEVWCHSFMLLMRQENRTWHIDSNVVLVCSRGLCSVLEGLHCSVPVRTTHKCDRCVYMQEFEVLMGSKDTVLHGHIMIESYCWWKNPAPARAYLTIHYDLYPIFNVVFWSFVRRCRISAIQLLCFGDIFVYQC